VTEQDEFARQPSEVVRVPLPDLEVELGIEGDVLVHWWRVETVVECPYGDFHGTVSVLYSVPVDTAYEDEIHAHVAGELLRDPWSVTSESRDHRRECWPSHLREPRTPS
jgi:hypothetical protein